VVFRHLNFLHSRRALLTGLATTVVALGSLSVANAQSAPPVLSKDATAVGVAPNGAVFAHIAGAPTTQTSVTHSLTSVVSLQSGVSIVPAAFAARLAVAKVLGISDDQLTKELQGSSLSNLARTHHVDPQLVSAALTSARQAEIDRAVKAGTLPADLAAAMRSRLPEAIGVEMNFTWSTANSGQNASPGVMIARSTRPAD
jgi:hypothetical protein